MSQASSHAQRADTVDTSRSDWSYIDRLWHYVRPHKALLFVTLALMPLTAFCNLIRPDLLERAVDDHLVTGEIDGLSTLALLFLAALAGQFVFQFGELYLMQVVGQRSLHDLRQDLFRHVQSLRMSFFHRNPTGRIMTRLTTDVDGLQEAVSAGLITIVSDVLVLAGIVGIMLYKNPRLALVTFACLPVLFGLSILFRILLRRAHRVARAKIARLNAYLQESVTGIEVVQSFIYERRARREFGEINADYRDAYFAVIRWDATLYALVEGIASIATAALIWYGARQAMGDAVSLGVLVAFIEYVKRFFIPIRDLSQKYATLQSAFASSERIFQLLEEDDRIEQPESPAPAEHLERTIAFEDVTFSYVPDEPVLRDVSFEVRKGEKIALVGHTGAGKSTILNLLLRLYDVDSGRVSVDGRDIREVDLASHRRRFSVVLQDVFLFQGTIRTNLTLGDPEISDAAIHDALRAVDAERVVDALPNGLDSPVVERGANLSTGQRQLLAFARALLHDPDVLILDEATSSVDTETEQTIQSAVAKLMETRTSIVVAHRLSTIRACDRILVFHRGRLVEAGPHDELLAKGEIYAKLYRLQYAGSESRREARTAGGNP